MSSSFFTLEDVCPSGVWVVCLVECKRVNPTGLVVFEDESCGGAISPAPKGRARVEPVVQLILVLVLPLCGTSTFNISSNLASLLASKGHLIPIPVRPPCGLRDSLNRVLRWGLESADHRQVIHDSVIRMLGVRECF